MSITGDDLTKMWGKLCSRIEELSARIDKIETNKTQEAKTIFVPECIKIANRNDKYGSAIIINSDNQGLFKQIINKGFTVSHFDSENTGENYKLVKADKIEDGKLYYRTNNESIQDINNIQNYVVGLENNDFCFWTEDDGISYGVVIARKYISEHIYEVVRLSDIDYEGETDQNQDMLDKHIGYQGTEE